MTRYMYLQACKILHLTAVNLDDMVLLWSSPYSTYWWWNHTKTYLPSVGILVVLITECPFFKYSD